MDLETLVRGAIEEATPYLRMLHGEAPLKALTGAKFPYDEQGSFESGSWTWEKLTDVVTGADYYKLIVIDRDGSRAAILKKATAFERNGYIYKKKSEDAPIYVAPLWEFRLEPTGERR